MCLTSVIITDVVVKLLGSIWCQNIYILGSLQ